MKSSRRMKRMARNKKKVLSLPLTSLMDVFTILVFFLLVNSGEVQVLPNAKALSLPESAAEQKPKETLVVMVNHNEILVQGRHIVDLTQPLPPGNLLPALKAELRQHAERAKASTLEPFSGNITIMGDKEIPYNLLKRVMATCADSEYPRVSLAVLRRAEKSEGGKAL